MKKKLCFTINKKKNESHKHKNHNKSEKIHKTFTYPPNNKYFYK